MGAECSCVKHNNEQEYEEYFIGSGVYKFKKFVCNEIIKIILIIIIYNIVFTNK